MENTQQKLDQSVFEGAPDWARWFAVDGDGRGFWYKHKPFELSDQWCPSIESHEKDNLFMGTYRGSLDWRETLIERAQ